MAAFQLCCNPLSFLPEGLTLDLVPDALQERLDPCKVLLSCFLAVDGSLNRRTGARSGLLKDLQPERRMLLNQGQAKRAISSAAPPKSSRLKGPTSQLGSR